MRISYKYGIRTISGKLDDLIHSAWNKGRVAIGRIFIMPTLVAQHFLFRDIKQNLASIWNECSGEFKEDLKLYATRRIPYYTPEQIPAYANYAHFIRFLYSFAKAEGIDLADVTQSELETAGCPTSVSEIIQADLLPKVAESDDLTNDW
jgi:hypothetical protein